MKYLRYFEDKHYLKNYFEKPLLNNDSFEDWSVVSGKSNGWFKTDYIDLVYEYNDKICVKMMCEYKNNGKYCTLYVNTTTASIKFRNVNLKKFDLKVLLDQVIRYDENVETYVRLKQFSFNFDDDDKIRFRKLSKYSLKNVDDFISFNDFIDELKEKYDYMLSGEDMGLL